MFSSLRHGNDDRRASSRSGITKERRKRVKPQRRSLLCAHLQFLRGRLRRKTGFGGFSPSRIFCCWSRCGRVGTEKLTRTNIAEDKSLLISFMKKKVKNVVCNTFTLIGFSAIHTNRGSESEVDEPQHFAFTFSLTHSTIFSSSSSAANSSSGKKLSFRLQSETGCVETSPKPSRVRSHKHVRTTKICRTCFDIEKKVFASCREKYFLAGGWIANILMWLGKIFFARFGGDEKCRWRFKIERFGCHWRPKWLDRITTGAD